MNNNPPFDIDNDNLPVCPSAAQIEYLLAFAGLIEPKPYSLFKLTLDYIVDRIENIKSLNGYPLSLGKKIFKAYVKKTYTSSDNTHFVTTFKDIQIFKTFISAYGKLVLETLNLTDNLLLINDHFDEISYLSLNITELNLNSCGLGDVHAMIKLIPQMSYLKILYLRENNLTTHGIQRMTYSLRMYDKGNKELQILDLSNNEELTDEIIPLLSKYKNLKVLHLSNTSITEEGIWMLEEYYEMIKSIDFELESISTTGWAKPIFEAWERAFHFREKDRSSPIPGQTFTHLSVIPPGIKRKVKQQEMFEDMVPQLFTKKS